MAHVMYGQQKAGGALDGLADAQVGYKKITAGVTLAEADGGVIHIADSNACAIVLPTISQSGVEYKFVMANDAGGSITITSADSAGNYYQGSIAVHSVDADDGFAANGTSNNVITMNATSTGGLLGSEVNLRSVVGIGWVVWGNVLGSNTTGATPFSG